MKYRLFFKSTFRQPIRTITLILLVGLISFAFASRVAEYALINEQTARMGEYYRAVGLLERFGSDNGPQRVSDYLEQSPYVETVDHVRYVSGVIRSANTGPGLLTKDIYNADNAGLSMFNDVVDGYTGGAPARYWFDMSTSSNDVFLYCTPIAAGETQVNDGSEYSATLPYYECRVEKVLTGYPEWVFEGKNIRVFASKSMTETGVSLPLGQRCLVRGHFYYWNSDNYNDFADVTLPDVGYSAYVAVPLYVDGPWYLEATADIDLSDERYAQMNTELRAVSDNQHALCIVGTADMSALPAFQTSNETCILTSGRLLTAEDDLAQNPVCVIHKGFADARKLQVGDTITVELRNTLHAHGYIEDAEAYADAGYRPGSGAAETVSLTVVGIYTYGPKASGNRFKSDFNDVYVPLTLIPENFTPTYPTEGDVTSFSLKTAADQEAFLEETKSELAALGYRASFIPNGWRTFQNTADTMIEASRYNLVMLGTILIIALAFIGFINFRFRKKDIAISRAMGMTARKCVAGAMLPFALFGAIGIYLGTWAAKEYVNSSAAKIFSEFLRFSQADAVELTTAGNVIPVFLGIFALFVVIGLICAAKTATAPLIELLQGGHPRVRKRPRVVLSTTGDSGGDIQTQGTAAFVPSEAPPLSRPTATQRKSGIGLMFRFAFRYVVRARGKNGLAVLLAIAFLMGLAFIQITIVKSEAELELLYSTIPVEVEIVRMDTSVVVPGEGYIYQRTVDRAEDSKYLETYYLEGAILLKGVHPLDGETGEVLLETGEGYTMLRGYENEDIFFSQAGRSNQPDFMWLEGWDNNAFAQDWAKGINGADSDYPVVLPVTLSEALGVELGGTIAIEYQSGRRNVVKVTVVGTYADNYGILMPLSAMRVASPAITYNKAVFCVNKDYNEKLDQVKAAVDEIRYRNDGGTVMLDAQVRDEALQEAVQPVEQLIRLTKALYPVALALSLLIAAGIAVLLFFTMSKEAAILRVLGNGKARLWATLCLYNLLVSLGGTVLGSAGAILLSIIVLPLETAAALAGDTLGRALCYILASLAGAGAAAVSATRKNPLELLQVKE